MALATDRVEIPTETTGWGGVRGRILIASVGPLVQDDGTTVHWADEAALSDPAWLDSLAGCPLTWTDDAHPGPEHGADEGTVDPAVIERHRIGTILDAVYDPEASTWPDGSPRGGTVGRYVVDTASGLALLQTRPHLREVSAGYRRTLDSVTDVDRFPLARYGPGTTGDWWLQRDRRANHVALVGAARGGPGTARLDTDGDAMDLQPIMDALEAIRARLDAMAAAESEDEDPPDPEAMEAAAAADAAARHTAAVAYHVARRRAEALGVQVTDEMSVDAMNAAALDAAAKVAARDADRRWDGAPGMTTATDSSGEIPAYFLEA